VASVQSALQQRGYYTYAVDGKMGPLTRAAIARYPREDLLTRARIEFEEELGIKPSGKFIPLGSVKQKGGKTVQAWAIEGDLPEVFELRSNTFQIEWPPRSGKLNEFPEIDRAEFFPEETARRKINPAQVAFLDRLQTATAR
jgi:predicted NUDIX family NTP pyrophosphohydrolase